MIRRVFKVLFVIILTALLLKGCLVKDIPNNSNKLREEKTVTSNWTYTIPKNITINGVDYLQSQAPIGNFGGELITSTIGEGPKTFNPFNCKDNTSQIMTSIM